SLTYRRPFHDVRKVPDFCPASNPAPLINYRGWMGEILRLFQAIEFYGDAAVAQRSLAGIQHFEYLQGTGRIGARSAPLAEALQEMLALQPQGLIFSDVHDLSLIAVGHRNTVHPVNAM